MKAAELQTKLVFSSDLEAVRSNRKLILAAREAANAELAIVNAFAKANQGLCKHPHKTSYSDPRDWGWNCPDCGAGG